MFYFHHFISNSQRLLMEVRRHNSLLHICCIYFILFTVKRYVYILSFVTQQRSLTLGTHAAKLRLIVLGTHATKLIHSSSLELMQQNSYTHRPWNSCSRTHTSMQPRHTDSGTQEAITGFVQITQISRPFQAQC